MSANGWIAAARRSVMATVFRRTRGHKPAGRKLTPGLETLETIDLMSAGLAHLTSISALGAPVSTSAYTITKTITTKSTPTQSTAIQTVTVPNTLTNFTASFAPSINLFDPNLGTLTAVHVTVQASLTSQIKAQNTSTTSTADITPFINGSYIVNGLNTTIANPLTYVPPVSPVTVAKYGGPQPVPFPPVFSGAWTAVWTNPPYDSSIPTSQTFPQAVASNSQQYTLTSAADLAYFTASAGNTTLTPSLVMNGQSGATAPNGNLQTDVRTSGSGVITVTYDYTPRCPNVVSLVRYGIHHQPTQLQLTFDGPVIPTSDATNPANYLIIVPNKHGSFTGPGVTYVAVKSAVWDAAHNTVTLTTTRQLNVHYLFELQVNLPCNNGNLITIQFGGKKSLGGFTNPHAGNVFVPVANGKVVKSHK